MGSEIEQAKERKMKAKEIMIVENRKGEINFWEKLS